MELNVARVRVPAALDASRAAALADAIGAATAPVVVLEGQDGTFCRGMDLETLWGGGASWDRDLIEAGVQAFGRVLTSIRTVGRPVIAVVDGAALGGGVGIAAAADMVLATSRASFALPEGLFGIIPAVVLPALLLRVTPQVATRLVLRARAHSADEALALGLADALVDDVESGLKRAVRELSRVRPEAVAELKRLTAEVVHLDFAQAIARGCAETTSTLLRPEVQTAVRAFSEGESPWA